MKKTLLGSLILLAFAGNVQAAPNADTKGTVTFFGKVVENTCKVKTDNRDMSVVLNDVGKTHLSQTGNTAMPTPFTITLQDCNPTATTNKPKATKVGVYFYSWKNADKENAYTLKNTFTNNDKADNVNIQLMEANGTDTIAVVGKETEDFVHKASSNNSTPIAKAQNHISGATVVNNQGDITLHYIAQYYATAQASAGKVQSSVDFQIAYE
ncbi:fimbrial protein [Haemophilus influenzae]|uniref:Major fimbrial subunit n=1 Tax=Haemophilus influenzae TaxID=727 RepID=A0AB37B340_HAEIF|nr:Major fimbrial subunit precursor [Haemophilus influenzae]PRM81919.1 Major fimbrial subunit precursor [Haemophilus influenzae]